MPAQEEGCAAGVQGIGCGKWYREIYTFAIGYTALTV